MRYIVLIFLLALTLTSCQTTKQHGDKVVRFEFIGEKNSQKHPGNIIIDLYFAKDSTHKITLEEMFQKAKNKKDEHQFLKQYGIQFYSIQVKPDAVFERALPSHYVPDTIFIKFSKKNVSGKWRYKTIDGKRYKTTLLINGNYIAAEQTPF